MDTDTQQRPAAAHRSFLPRRSRGDRKVAGVAGGLGRAFGVDPVLIRVAFVVLAVFGGSGVLLYCLGWLLMPADGDEVSAVEALAGRGQSSVSPALTIVLIIIGLSSAGSVFSWGLPFWPVVIAAIIVFALVRHGRVSAWRRSGSGQTSDWRRRPGEWNQHRGDWGRWAGDVAERAAAWGDRAGQWGQRWAGGDGSRHACSRVAGPTPASPFGRPAFWEEPPPDSTATTAPSTGWAAPDPSTRQQAGAPASPSGPAPAPAASDPAGDTTEGPSGAPPAGAERSAESPSPEDLLTQGRRTPPAWDPLGVAPFAWDLPDPAAEPSVPSTGPARGRSVLARLFLGLALVTGGVLAGGVFAGWWAISWAMVAGITLAVIGLGLLVSSLRGTGGRPLIGLGVFLSLVTLALTVTGISGTSEYGQHTWTPTSVADVQHSYTWNAGQATLDLSQLEIPKGTTVTTDLIVNGGQATVLVPKDVTVHATCSARVGDVRCLDGHDDGVKPQATGQQTGDDQHGTLTIEVRSNAGQAQVRTHG